MVAATQQPLRLRVAKRGYQWLTESNKARFNILYGGASSAKSWSMGLYLALDKFWKLPGVGILIVRKTHPSVRISCWRLMHHWLSELDLLNRCRVNSTASMIYSPGGAFMQFTGLDDVEKIKCYHPDTEILTERGFVPVSQVKTGDKVASMDPATRQASYQPVTKTWAYDYDGPMIRPMSATGDHRPYVDFCVTADHNMLIRTDRRKDLRFVKAKDLPGSFWIPRSATWGGLMRDTYTITHGDSNHTSKTTTFPIVPFLKFIGWFQSEGSFGDKARHMLQISQTKPEGRARIKSDLKDFPYKIWEQEAAFCLSGTDLYDYLMQFGRYSHERRIPPDILQLHPSLLRHLFDALMAGDGTRTKTGRYVYCTNSPGLADDVMVLAMKLGYTPTAQRRLPNYKSNYPNGRPYWSISISEQTDTVITKKESIPYKGSVYCLCVPPHHTVLTRFNGRVMWCGQSIEGINYIWVEEATEIAEHDLWQLHIRCRAKNPYGNNAIFLTFNPVDPVRNKWLRDITRLAPEGNYLKRPIRVLMLTYKDNPFLSPEERATIEGLADADEEYNKIYRLGQWATPTNIIFDNWDVVETIPAVDDYGYGLDFGYANPSALIWCGIKDETHLYLREVIYQTHLHNQDLIQKLKEEGVQQTDLIVADSAEPAYIDEIAEAGFDVHACEKAEGQGGASFVRTGIDRMKRYHIHVLKDSVNLIEELGQYKSRTNKDSEVLDEPLKFRDHAIDAARYLVGSRPEPAETIVMQIPSWLKAELMNA